MSEKALKSALGVLAGLVLLYALVTVLGDGGGAAPGGGELAAALSRISEAEVEAVTIAGPQDDTVRLTRGEGGGWRANGHLTDSAAVARFWTAVSEVQVRDLVAGNPANHGRLGVSADSTWSVAFQIGDGGPVRVLLGSPGPSFTSHYSRHPDEDAVYLVDGGLRGAATRRLDDWRDRTIVAVDTARVASVTVTRDGASSTVVRGGEGWTVDGDPADSLTVRNLLSELSSVEATGFADEGAPFQGEDLRSVTALDADGQVLARIETAGDGTDVLARAEGNSMVYRFTTWRADRLAPEALKAAPDEGGWDLTIRPGD